MEMSDAVVRAGGRALVLCQSGRLIGEAREAGAEIIEFPAKTKNPARILWNAQRIAALVEREQVDIVGQVRQLIVIQHQPVQIDQIHDAVRQAR